jgi:hypothetical protein
MITVTHTKILFAAEEQRVIGWRAEGLGRAGFEPGAAMKLALRADVDLHRAVSLVRLGCPPATAVRILL